MADPLIPPRSLDYGTAIHHFKEVGEEYVRYAISPELGGLRPDGEVLDVGSGLGRFAVPLTAYLSADGHYEGFDIVLAGVNWCRTHITPRFPNFRFTLVDVENFCYRAGVGVRASSFRFPYYDGRFDLVFLRSVFTHMLPDEIDHYLGEITRVLKLGGRCLISYFLLNRESARLMAVSEGAKKEFTHRDKMTMRDGPDGDTIAYDEGYILGLYANHDLRLVGPVRYGSWCGREEYLSSQDIIVATKVG
jgi:SAM-dependent methyltransferase